MTNEQIEKGLECCAKMPCNDCDNCPYEEFGCKQELLEDALTYITDLKANLNEETVQLPVKFDTPLYFLWSRHQAINYVKNTSGIYETTDWKYSLSKNGIYITTTGRSVSYCGRFLYKLGETVFLTKEEAEAKLKELEGKNG